MQKYSFAVNNEFFNSQFLINRLKLVSIKFSGNSSNVLIASENLKYFVEKYLTTFLLSIKIKVIIILKLLAYVLLYNLKT